jgi:hypothetical protein
MLSLKDLKKLDRDDLLDLVGLQRASSNDWVAPALTALGVGLLAWRPPLLAQSGRAAQRPARAAVRAGRPARDPEG